MIDYYHIDKYLVCILARISIRISNMFPWSCQRIMWIWLKFEYD